MCDPVSLFVAGAATTAYSAYQAKSAAKDQKNTLKKQARRERNRAMSESLEADTGLRKERSEGYASARTAKRAAQTQTAGTAQSFGPRSFFATA